MRQEAAIPNGKGLKTIVTEALESYGSPFEIGESYCGPSPTVLCLLLESHWWILHRKLLTIRRELMPPTKGEKLNSKLRLGIFISRTLWSWPACLEEVIPAVYPLLI